MNNVLVINGSPRIKKSNTLNLTKAFCKGLSEKINCNITTINVYDSNIKDCMGCFNCWTSSPGKCILNDDMNNIIQQYQQADIVIWSFPLYYFGMPSKIKAFMDRLLPFNLPTINTKKNGNAFHTMRVDLTNQKHILISTCGFFTTNNNYDALIKQFEIFTAEQKNPLIKILCPEGELFSVPALKNKCDNYLAKVKIAGTEVAEKNCISVSTQEQLEEVLYPPEIFMKMANASWNIKAETDNSLENEHEKKQKEIENFVIQMSATYNPTSYEKPVIIELNFTDAKKRFFLHLKEQSCEVENLDYESTKKATTTILTTYSVWKDISAGKINGAEAMMKGLYKIKGDFATMQKMGTYFGDKQVVENNKPNKKLKKSNMLFLLSPWIILWIFLPINNLGKMGAGISIGLCALFYCLGLIFKMTPYDKLTATIVSMFSLLVLFKGVSPILISSTFFTFGLIWFSSSLIKIPLTAYYSCHENGGEKAFSNPLFIKTNRILTKAWGILYLITGVASYFLLTSSLKSYTGLILQVTPFLMGMFTRWFKNWYPEKIARGE